jgi:hypothetical protein
MASINKPVMTVERTSLPLPDQPVVMTGFRALVAQGIFAPARSCL